MNLDSDMLQFNIESTLKFVYNGFAEITEGANVVRKHPDSYRHQIAREYPIMYILLGQ